MNQREYARMTAGDKAVAMFDQMQEIEEAVCTLVDAEYDRLIAMEELNPHMVNVGMCEALSDRLAMTVVCMAKVLPGMGDKRKEAMETTIKSFVSNLTRYWAIAENKAAEDAASPEAIKAAAKRGGAK